MYASRTPTPFLIMDPNDDPVSRAERALYDIQELADSTAEHHPYCCLLYTSDAADE